MKKSIDEYTIENIPVLKKETLDVLIRDYKIRRDDDNLIEYINNVLKNINKTNSVYYHWCEDIYFNYKNSQDELKREIYISQFIGLVLGYEALRRQGESNNMEEENNLIEQL